MESILTDIKKLLGIAEEYDHFDSDIIIYINSTFAILTQLGVGPSTGFYITDKTQTWSEFVTSNIIKQYVITYTGLRVKLIFDPPSNSNVSAAMKKNADELEWRILVEVEKEGM